MVNRDTYKINGEVNRIYHYEEGADLYFRNVTELQIGSSGSHYLKYDNGALAYIPNEWKWIEITAHDWSA